VIRDTISSSVGLRFGFRILTLPGPSTSSSKSSPVLSFAAVAMGFGIRTAKLLPHFASCVFKGPRVYAEYIPLDAVAIGRGYSLAEATPRLLLVHEDDPE
jgi:hypothetical protein